MIVSHRRYCTVDKCRTGLRVEKEKRKKLGLRQLSLFRAPSDLILREKWSQILGQTLADKDSVCELHFPSDAIEKYYNTRLPNGMMHKIQRVRFSLRRNALPLQEKREPKEKNVNSTDNTEPNYLKLEIVGSHSLIVIDNKIKEYEAKQNWADHINELLRLSEENIGLQETIGFYGDKIIDLNDPDSNHGLENSFKNNTCTEIKSPVKSSNMDNSNQSSDVKIPIIQTKPQDDHCYFFKSNEIENNKQQKIDKEMPIQENLLDQNSTQKASSSVKSGSLLTNQLKETKNKHVTQHEMEGKIPHLVKRGATLQLSPKYCTPKKMASIPVINAPVSQEKLLQRPIIINNVPDSQEIVSQTSIPKTNPLVLQKKGSQGSGPINNPLVLHKRVLQESIAISNPIVSQKNQTQQPCKKRKTESAEPTEFSEALPFNLNALREYFVKNPLPKSWTWIENKKFDAIIFVQISRATQHIRCYVECTEDLSIHVSTFDRYEIKQLDCVVTSIDDILNLLMKVYNLRLCEATAVNETRSENCSLVLTEEETRKRKLPVDRCLNCRTNEKKSKISKSLNLPKIRIDVNKNRELSLKLYQVTRSCEYYREKCENLKKMLEKLKKLCVTSQNSAKKTALDEAISQLPSLQQEVVRTCFDNVNIDSKQRRYEANYAYECFLLQAISDAAYEHIKQRNLIPLPCKSTLNAIVGGEAKT